MNNPQLRKPNDESLRRFLASQRPLAFTYQAVAATVARDALPAGYAVEEISVPLGQGIETFAIARQGIEAWAQFDLGWCEAWPRETAIRPGEVVAVVARSMGLWWANAARIVYVIDDRETSADAATMRFGFAYGTLPGHVEMGEELFLVEWNRVRDAVTYRILAFSRPQHLLARLGRPLVRRLQGRFREDSAAAMLRWMKNRGPASTDLR